MTYDTNRKLYVTLDGTFGEASDLMFIDTKDWTEQDYDWFDNWTDGERWDFVATGSAARLTPTQYDEERGVAS